MAHTQQGLYGISPETRTKLKTLSIVLHKPIIHLVELMTDRLWEEKQDLISSAYSQLTINREVRKILKDMVPK